MNAFRSVCRIVPILLAGLFTVLVEIFYVVLVEIPTDSSFHFGLMTVNALFGGFLYSNYGLLVSLLDKELIQKVKCTNIMEKRNADVFCGIVYATFSVLCGLVIVFMSDRLNSFVLCFAVNGEIVFMISAIGFYLLSLLEMNRLLKALNKDDKKRSKRDMKDLVEKVKSECGMAVNDNMEEDI